MPHNDDDQINYTRLIKLVIISSPLFLFIIYLFQMEKLTLQELVIFIITLALPIIIIIRYFLEKMAALDRQTTLQIHDSNINKNRQLLLMNIMEKLSDPLLILDSHNRILMANKSAHILLGDHILKQEISVFIRNSDLENTMLQAQQTGEPKSCEFKFGHPHAKDYLTRVHLFDLTNNQGESPVRESVAAFSHQNHFGKKYLFLALYDISAMKRSDKMRADFVANASHELRTPLASILGFIETLQGPARDDKEAHERFLKIMHNEATRMNRLTEGLLSLSRIERDQHIPPSDNVKICRLIENVSNTLEPQAKAKEMRIAAPQTDEITIEGDYDQLTQLFQNIIENAIKYGREKTDIDISITGNTMPPPLKTKEVIITIANQGDGIPAEHLPRLMERFYRVDSARARNDGGSGLGLAIVKHIIQRHRGRISFASEINGTTTVTFALPEKNS
ncbi:MAG: ATP-binding protein [Emcibacter sp.]|nr:ATP-binding protein [Emcibacter sp.]